MAKYDPLREHLREQRSDAVRMRFEEGADVVVRGLPASAYVHQAWWANEESGTYGHARAWLDAGFRTKRLSLGV